MCVWLCVCISRVSLRVALNNHLGTANKQQNKKTKNCKIRMAKSASFLFEVRPLSASVKAKPVRSVKSASAAMRPVPAFSIESLQKNTYVMGPPKAQKRKSQRAFPFCRDGANFLSLSLSLSLSLFLFVLFFKTLHPERYMKSC